MGVSPRGKPGEGDPSLSPPPRAEAGGVLATAGDVEVLLLLFVVAAEEAEGGRRGRGRIPVARSPALLPGREEEEEAEAETSSPPPRVLSLPLLSLPTLLLPPLRDSVFFTDRSKGSLRPEDARTAAAAAATVAVVVAEVVMVTPPPPAADRVEAGWGKEEENEVKGVALAASTRGREEEGAPHRGRGGRWGSGE